LAIPQSLAMELRPVIRHNESSLNLHRIFLALTIAGTILAKTWHVDGIVIAVDRAASTMLVSHRPIENYMGAMAMPFRVENTRQLEGLYPGVRIQFDLMVTKQGSLARNIRKTGEPDALIPPPKETIKIGDPVPDFSLTSETGNHIRLADLRGKVVAVNFLYTRCPLPDVCPRLAANFATLQRHFADRMGADLVFLSVTVDPDFDTPAILAEYAKRWGAKNPGWRFLTGDVTRIAASLGEVYWTDEGSIGHNSTTSIVDRNGRLAATVTGSTWRLDQLEQLLKHEMEKPQ
jgi:protein SCO1/2